MTVPAPARIMTHAAGTPRNRSKRNPKTRPTIANVKKALIRRCIRFSSRVIAALASQASTSLRVAKSNLWPVRRLAVAVVKSGRVIPNVAPLACVRRESRWTTAR